MLVLPLAHTPWLTAAVAAMVTWTLWSDVASVPAARRMTVPPAFPDESRLEMIDQSPLTSTHPAPRSVESGRLEASPKETPAGRPSWVGKRRAWARGGG